MKENNAPLWLEWAKELQFIAQAGLTYSKDPFDLERFERIREISAEIMSHQSDLPVEKVKNLFCNETGFQTPKLDTRAAIFKDDKISPGKRKGRCMVFTGRLGRRESNHQDQYGKRGKGRGGIGCESSPPDCCAGQESAQRTTIRIQCLQGFCTV